VYQRKDRFYRKAKQLGLRSRAAFKLEDLDRGLIATANRVVDLGCWPGGWLQVASRQVGPSGTVVGVDVRPLDSIGLANVRLIQGDVCEPKVVDDIASALGGQADVVLSDMAPSLTGVRDRDEARASQLVTAALGVAQRLLRPGGTFVCKVFMNAAYADLRDAIGRCFERVSTTRSEATRKGSSELYVIARGFRPEPMV
jgi:23S rRNA (uridine2552-2'-O)-methyltransferase